jgi:hypothetical protein
MWLVREICDLPASGFGSSASRKVTVQHANRPVRTHRIMQKTNWTVILILLLLVAAVLWLGGGFLMWGGRTGIGMHGMMAGWRPASGMGGWFFGPMAVFGIFGMLLPLGILALLVLGAVWLFQRAQSSATEDGPTRPTGPAPAQQTCPSCGRVTEPDWRLCPTCGYALADKRTEPAGQSSAGQSTEPPGG